MKARCRHNCPWFADCPWCKPEEHQFFWQTLSGAYAGWMLCNFDFWRNRNAGRP